MILDIIGARASWDNNNISVAFDVVPDGCFHLDLKSGEIFQNNSYAALRKQHDTVISATLFVTRQERNAAGAELPSEMRYMGGELQLIWRLPDNHLAGFHSLIIAGQTPRQAIVSLQSRALEFGWEPDGSGQKWDNEISPSVPIENVSFHFVFNTQPSDPSLNTEVPDSLDYAFFSDAARVNFALLRRLSSIELSISRLSWAVGLIAGLIALFRILH